ncbi:hypothetical protein E6W39_09810 [Kitasatospora acidiphila]|uniref:Uncharacterized protein n=1 Tax=Kitasatospora acidiphila TaxID=2567942 RepID=A0A540W0G2_9ACTN|nr:hypothetical protein [Kitasatospora acidiphila]TQF02515.1 hypothetical protein E6W39_09810 [Kitasatospora acidiphila]
MTRGWQIPVPPITKWRPGRCHCCGRPTLVAPGPVVTVEGGAQVAVPWCLFGFERANRMLRRATLGGAAPRDLT